MKHIKLYEELNNFENIKHYCELYNITDYTINPDNSIDVNGDVNLSINKGLLRIPLKFKNVYGNFECMDTSIETLEGCPEYVGGHFDIARNENLKSLRYSPKKVKGYFDCQSCNLTSLRGCAIDVGDSFDCGFNENLKSLKYSPKYLGSDFECIECDLTSLEGIPNIINGDLFINFNTSLKSLRHLPSKIYGDFEFTYCNIKNFKNTKSTIIGNLNGTNNDITTLDNFPTVEGDIFLSYESLPDKIIYNRNRVKEIINNQNFYKIWNEDGSFNVKRFNIMIDDIRND